MKRAKTQKGVAQAAAPEATQGTTATRIAVVEQAPEALAEVLSISQMYTFMDCPARWMFKYQLGLPDPPNANLALGSAVHEAIGMNMAQKVLTEEDLPGEEVVKEFGKHWAARLDEVEWHETDNPEALGAEGAALVAKYMAEHAPMVQPAAVEVHVTGTIGGVRVQGHVDLLCADGTVRDLKTAQRTPTEISAHNMLQLATYERLCPGASGQVAVDTLVRNKTPKLVTIQHTINDQDRLAPERIFPLAQEAMRSGYFMPNRTSNLCSRKNCAHWRACEDEFGGRVKGAEAGGE